MTKRGLEVAAAYGANLPEFGSLREAKKALFAQRDDALKHLREIADKAKLEVALDGPESLLILERFYFHTVESRGFRRLGTTKTRIEEAFGFFVASLLVTNIAGAKWIVERFAFGGSGYEIGVELDELMRICGVDGLFVDLDLSEPNKLKRLMHREYARYASTYGSSSSATPKTKTKTKPKKKPKPRYGTGASETTRSTKTGRSATSTSTTRSTASRTTKSIKRP